MFYQIMGFLYGVIAVTVVLCMAKATDRRILDLSNSEAEPYTAAPGTWAVLAGIIVISAICGALISKYAVSGVAVVKLGICYFAILASAVIDYKLRIIPNYSVCSDCGMGLDFYIRILVWKRLGADADCLCHWIPAVLPDAAFGQQIFQRRDRLR